MVTSAFITVNENYIYKCLTCNACLQTFEFGATVRIRFREILNCGAVLG